MRPKSRVSFQFPRKFTSIADQAAALFCERASVLDLDLRRQFPIDVTQDANPCDEAVIYPVNLQQNNVSREPECQLLRRPCSHSFARRSYSNAPRSPDHKSENAALTALASALVDSPGTILQALADKVIEVLHADSAGLSLLDERWKSGLLGRHSWRMAPTYWRRHPREFGPCGDVLDQVFQCCSAIGSAAIHI